MEIDTIWVYDAREAANTFRPNNPTFCDGVAFSDDDGSYAIEIIVAEE